MVFAGSLAGMLIGAGHAARAEELVNLPDVVELSGAGVVSGTNWRNGVTLASEEINAGKGILGRKIKLTHYDTQSNPGISRAQIQKAIDLNPYVILGPIFSGSVKVNMMLAQAAGIPQLTGAEAADITQTGNPYIFRTSFGQQAAMPRVASYLQEDIKAKTVAIVWVNNDFGKGGHDAFVKNIAAKGIKVVADVGTESGQADFAADVVKVKQSGADALFIYENEEEAARLLIELKKQGYAKPIVGDTNLLSQKVIELAGSAANGVSGFVGLSAEVPVKAIQDFREKYAKHFNSQPDHNAIKGYMAVYTIKYVTEKNGSFDRKKFADKLHGMTIKQDEEPGILLTTRWDAKGDVDRVGFIGQVVNGKTKIVTVLRQVEK